MKVEFDIDDENTVKNLYEDLEKLFYNLIISNKDGKTLFKKDDFNEITCFFDEFEPIYSQDLFDKINEKLLPSIIDDNLCDYIIDRIMDYLNTSLAKKTKYRILYFYPDNVPDSTRNILNSELGEFKNIKTKKAFDSKFKQFINDNNVILNDTIDTIDSANNNESETLFDLKDSREKYKSIIIN